ncbi:hypothetical protein EIP86_001238 [Pleurotus ostreatoroseus]|nr:hypothetical protein EIP86_001238 [Pleurotus ostreatoroseus]
MSSAKLGLGLAAPSSNVSADHPIAAFMRRVVLEKARRHAPAAGPAGTQPARSCGARAASPLRAHEATESVNNIRAPSSPTPPTCARPTPSRPSCSSTLDADSHVPHRAPLATPAMSIPASPSRACSGGAASSPPRAPERVPIPLIPASATMTRPRRSTPTSELGAAAMGEVAHDPHVPADAPPSLPPTLPSTPACEPGSSHMAPRNPSSRAPSPHPSRAPSPDASPAAPIPSTSTATPATPAPAPLTLSPAPPSHMPMSATHPLVTRLLASLPATSPAAGLALPHAQLVARRALQGSRGRCWTTQLFPPRVAHDRTCGASHLRLVPLPQPTASSAAAEEEKEKSKRGAKGKFKAKAKGKDKDRVRLPRGQFAIEKDVERGWVLPRPVDVNRVLGLHGKDALDAEAAERVFALAALAVAYEFESPVHFTLWGSTTAVMTAKRVERFLESGPVLPVRLPVAWTGVASTLWTIQGQHVQRFAHAMPYLHSHAAALADAEGPTAVPTTSRSSRTTRNADRADSPALAIETPAVKVAPLRKPPPPTHWPAAPGRDTAALSDWTYVSKEERGAAQAEVAGLRELFEDWKKRQAQGAGASESPRSQCSSLPSLSASTQPTSSASTPLTPVSSLPSLEPFAHAEDPTLSGPEANRSLSEDTCVASVASSDFSRDASVDTCVSDALSTKDKGAKSSSLKRKRDDEAWARGEEADGAVASKRARRTPTKDAASRAARRLPSRRAAGRS